MAVTGLSEADFRQSKGELQLENVYIACFNSPSNLTVGGPDAELDKLQAAVVAKGGYWKQVETHGKAFHHPKLRGRLSFIEKRLRGELGGGRATLSFASSSTGSVTWISTSTSQGGLINSPGRDAVSYFSASLAEPVQFAHAVAILLPGSTVYEVGPSSGLLRLVTQCRPKLHTAPLVKRHRPDTEASLGSPPPPGSKPAYQTVFVFCGEGAHDSSTDVSLLQSSPAWEEVTQAMREVTNRDLAEFLHAERGSARAPDSILFTTVVNILHAALWRSWGVEPNVAVGHSSGDVAAAHACGMYTTVQVLA